VTEIPGIVFQYTAGRLDNLRSIAAGVHFRARQLGPLVDRLHAERREFGADLVVTDFEPGRPLTVRVQRTARLRPRAARSCQRSARIVTAVATAICVASAAIGIHIAGS